MAFNNSVYKDNTSLVYPHVYIMILLLLTITSMKPKEKNFYHKVKYSH